MTEQSILIAGGYGVVGQRIAAELGPDYPVIVAGRDLEQAKAASAVIGHGVRSRLIDVTVEASIAAGLEDVATVVSCIGEHWAVLRHAPIRDPVLGVLALIEKWGVDAQASPEPVTQQVTRERIRGRTLRGQDAHPRRTV